MESETNTGHISDNSETGLVKFVKSTFCITNSTLLNIFITNMYIKH